MTFKLNPEVANFDLIIPGVNITNLETEGWDFDELHHNTAQHEGIDFDGAKEHNYHRYDCTLWVEGESPSPKVYWAWSDINNNGTDKEESGDDKQSILDIISLLDSGLITIKDQHDLSTDADGNDVPTFIKA